MSDEVLREASQSQSQSRSQSQLFFKGISLFLGLVKVTLWIISRKHGRYCTEVPSYPPVPPT